MSLKTGGIYNVLKRIKIIGIVVVCVLLVHVPANAADNTPVMSLSWAWPSATVYDGNAWQWVPSGNDHDDQEWDFLWSPYENDDWWALAKPYIVRDIDDMLARLQIGPGDHDRRHGLNLGIQMPVFVMSTTRATAIVERFFEIAREKDLPISFKMIGYVWWDYERAIDSNVIWSKDKYPNTWSDHVEWWGWAPEDPVSDQSYVWGTDPDNNYRYPAETVWRDWGAPFPIHIPHPDFDDPAFREKSRSKIEPIAEEIGYQYAQLANDKRYLLTAFITENEVAYGWSFFPYNTANKAGASQYGVHAYIRRNCPDNVMDCLPAKPAGVSDAQWIHQKSQDLWRPADFNNTLIQAGQDYLAFVGRMAYDAGLPREKVFSQALLEYNLQTGKNQSSWVRYYDAALNDYSTPGYSFYGHELSSPTIVQYLRELKTLRGIETYGMIEYLDYGNLDKWRSDLAKFTDNRSADMPRPTFVNLQNWDNTIMYKTVPYTGGPSGNVKALQTDPNFYAGAELVNERLDLAEEIFPAQRLVRQYYREFLGWDLQPGNPGFDSHVGNLLHFGCYKVVMDFVRSSVFAPTKTSVSNRDYVRILYRAIVSREPDSNGWNWWTAQLSSGNMTRDSIVQAMYQAPEAQAVCASGKVIEADDSPPPQPEPEPEVQLTREERLVSQYYREFLGWDVQPDFPGFDAHVDILLQHGCYHDVMVFVQSDAFALTKSSVSDRDYVRILYRAIVSREPDSNGWNWWAAQLSSGNTTRDSIVHAMFQAPEVQAVCESGKVIE